MHVLKTVNCVTNIDGDINWRRTNKAVNGYASRMNNYQRNYGRYNNNFQRNSQRSNNISRNNVRLMSDALSWRNHG